MEQGWQGVGPSTTLPSPPPPLVGQVQTKKMGLHLIDQGVTPRSIKCRLIFLVYT